MFLASAGATTDSRRITPGTIFFALRGATFDGNRYAADALAKGAAYAVVDDPRVAVDERYLVVTDVLLSLQNLAAHHRRTLDIPILAITGTNGKTTTKELIFRVLAAKFKVSVTRGNLNNHIGVPLTLLAMTGDTQFGVVEMGASSVGEIATLCDIAAPDFGIITNVGKAHLEGFGSYEGVKKAKGELYDYLAAHGGKAFVPIDDEEVTAMASRSGLNTVPYSAADGCGIENSLAGDYNLRNIAAAVAVGRYFGVREADIKRAVESYKPDNNRSQKIDTDRNSVILDCYNANPSSMRAAISDFAGKPSATPKTVILGDMMELGVYSATEHTEILSLLDAANVDSIYLVGTNFMQAVRDYHPRTDRTVKAYPDLAGLREYLTTYPVSGQKILVKGSRAIGLENILELL